MLELNPFGYNLIEKNSEEWYLQVVNRVAFTGTFKEVVQYAMFRLGFKFEEIQFAVDSMVENEVNAAHFGMYKKFIYTFQHGENSRKVS